MASLQTAGCQLLWEGCPNAEQSCACAGGQGLQWCWWLLSIHPNRAVPAAAASPGSRVPGLAAA